MSQQSPQFPGFPPRLHAALLASLESSHRLEDIAHAHDVQLDQLTLARQSFLAGARSALSVAQPTSAPRKLSSAARACMVSAFAFVAVSSFVGGVHADARQELRIFSAGQVARADEINANFALLRNWIEQKTGPVNSNVVTLSGAALAPQGVTVKGTGLSLEPDADQSGLNEQLRLWNQPSPAGQTCEKACGEAVCLAAYNADGSTKRIECSTSMNLKACACVGR